MLVIFFGVSCVGKTEIIRHFHSNHDWNVIPTYMTRKTRENEFEKVSVSNHEMDKLINSNFFWCVNDFAGNRYGTPYKHISKSQAKSSNIWCIDFPISESEKLTNLKFIPIIVIPESKEQLIRQIQISKRIDRKEQILNDLSNNYNKSVLEKHKHVVINREGALKNTCEEVLKIISKYS